MELSAYQTQTRRKKLTGAYSDKSPLVTAFLLREELELALYSSDGRCMVFHTAVLAPKTTRTTQGVNVMALKPKRTVTQVLPLAETAIVNAARYRAAACLWPGPSCGRRTGGRSSCPFWSNSRSGLGVIKQKAVSL